MKGIDGSTQGIELIPSVNRIEGHDLQSCADAMEHNWQHNENVNTVCAADDASACLSCVYIVGVLAAEGPHRSGTRVGVWTSWHESGAKHSEGMYQENNREGAWNFWDEDGELSAAGMYAAGDRVGDWYLRPRPEEEAERDS